MSPEDKRKVVYYDDEANDDFAGTNIQKCVVDETFPFIHKGRLWRGCAFFLYYFVAFPLVWLFMRGILGVRFVNRKAMKEDKCRSYFLYGNHTGFIDAFTPNLLSFPRRNYIIVGADTVSIKGLRNIVQMFGALPIPTQFRGMREFMRAVGEAHNQGNITVYPEAHIWPYFTGVREFPDTSFAYPVKHKAPVFAFFTAYTKPKGLLSFLRKANITVYVSDPIFPEPGLTDREAKKDLRDKVYRFMVEKSSLSDYEVIRYIPRTRV